MIYTSIHYHEDQNQDSFIQMLHTFYILGQHKGPPPLPGHPDDLPTVDAEVNYGRWLVECPDGCKNALMVSRMTPLFICGYCASDWYRVAFPDDREEIEELLMARPVDRQGRGIENRSWLLRETVADLRTENLTHGIGQWLTGLWGGDGLGSA